MIVPLVGRFHTHTFVAIGVEPASGRVIGRPGGMTDARDKTCDEGRYYSAVLHIELSFI
jgi:hypothetical protein